MPGRLAGELHCDETLALVVLGVIVQPLVGALSDRVDSSLGDAAGCAGFFLHVPALLLIRQVANVSPRALRRRRGVVDGGVGGVGRCPGPLPLWRGRCGRVLFGGVAPWRGVGRPGGGVPVSLGSQAEVDGVVHTVGHSRGASGGVCAWRHCAWAAGPRRPRGVGSHEGASGGRGKSGGLGAAVAAVSGRVRGGRAFGGRLSTVPAGTEVRHWTTAAKGPEGADRLLHHVLCSGVLGSGFLLRCRGGRRRGRSRAGRSASG
jgi:hypothetical protein